MSLRWTLIAPAYDRMSRSSEEAGLGEMRQGLLADAAGRVLEIGAGTGVNLPYYGEGVESLALTDPEPPMLRRLERAANEHRPDAQVLRASADELPFEDDSFDVLVSTLVLCGVDDQSRALTEARRVLRPGGRLLFIEHVRSDDPSLARFQDRFTRLNRFLVGCDCNRQTLTAIETEQFEVSRVEHTTTPKAPKFVRPLIVGAAISKGGER
jgi:ubiquinone/menaquinone biosynthesis C-methylase UbiE